MLVWMFPIKLVIVIFITAFTTVVIREWVQTLGYNFITCLQKTVKFTVPFALVIFGVTFLVSWN